MKKTVTIAALGAALLLPSGVLADGASNDEIAKELQFLKERLLAQEKQLAAQQKLIEALEAKVGEQPAPAAKEAAQPAEPAAKPTGTVQLANKFIDNLTLKGDLRLRYERLDLDKPAGLADTARDRFRTRFRVGGVWRNDSENWEVGAGLATGDSNSSSTNDTWSDDGYSFDTGDIRLDYAYARHRLGESASLTIGQDENPFMTSWLLWDSDVRPAGFTGRFNQGGLFVTAGGYDVYQAGNDVAMMFAGQIGYDGKIDALGYRAAVTYYDYDGKIFDLYTRPNAAYEYRIGTLDGELTMPLGSSKLKAYGQVFQNFGAEGAVGQGLLGGTLDPEDENLGWVLGLEARIGKVQLGYAYAQVGADSVIPALKDGDFGSGIGTGVDVEGHKLQAFYNFSGNFSMGITALLYEPMTRSATTAGVEDAGLYQVDCLYKF